jgi:hypothetical protein
MARVLLDRGQANYRIRNRAGETALALAVRCKHTDFAEMLQKWIRESRKRFLLKVFSVKEWFVMFGLVVLLVIVWMVNRNAEALSLNRPPPAGGAQFKCSP